jgi:hypothetical protein
MRSALQATFRHGNREDGKGETKKMAIIDKTGRPIVRPGKPQPPTRLIFTPEEDKAQLLALMNAALKADRKKFGGRPEYTRVFAAIFPSLNPTQVALLRDGAFGEVMARAVSHVEQYRKRTGQGGP